MKDHAHWDEWTEPYTGHTLGWWEVAYNGYSYNGISREFIMEWFQLYTEVELIERERK